MTGTKIILQEIKRERLGRGVTALRKRLARRFSIIGAAHNFEVTISGEKITPADRGDLPAVQFLWPFGDSDSYLESAPKLKENEKTS